MSDAPRFYAAPNFLKMGIKMPRSVVLWTTSTIKDEKSDAKFHYIKTVSGKVVAHSIAFRVVSIYWQGDDPLPLKSCLQVTCPMGPHLTQCGQGRGLPTCQVSSWSVQPFGHNTPTSQTDRQTGQTDRQQTDSIGRTVLQTVAQKLLHHVY